MKDHASQARASITNIETVFLLIRVNRVTATDASLFMLAINACTDGDASIKERFCKHGTSQ